MEYRKENDKLIVRLEKGEEIVESLKKLATQESIEGAFFVGLGAVDHLEIAHYSLNEKKYSTEVFDEALEIVNLTGNIALLDSEIIAHAHGTFSRPDMSCFGGHLMEGIVSGTFEAILFLTSPLERFEDAESGLKLLKI